MLLSVVLITVAALAVTLPVWLSAKLFSAGNDSWLACLGAAIASSVAFQGINAMVGSLGGVLLGAVAVALVFQHLLKLIFMNGLWASFIAFGIQLMLVGTFKAQLAKLVITYA